MTEVRYHDRHGRLVALGPALGAGGEGTVYAILGDKQRCAKIYPPSKAQERAGKLSAMIVSRPRWFQRGGIVWPSELLYRDETFAGFVMPCQRGMLELHRVLVPDERMQIAGYLTARDLCLIAAQLARVVERVHRAGHCVGDLKPQNILIAPLTGEVALIDTDSFQVRERVSGPVHPSSVVTPEYTARELVADPAHTLRTPASDAFALAVLVHQILLGGAHPFEGELVSNRVSLERVPGRIRHGQCAMVSGVTAVRPAPGALSVAALHPALRELFARCFGAGHVHPEQRPSAREWRKALIVASKQLARCAASEAHWYERGLPRCPWCERRERTGVDLFPAGQSWQRVFAGMPAPIAAPEHVRMRWLKRHVRRRMHAGSVTAAERAWLFKAGAALGFDRGTVTRTIDDLVRASGFTFTEVFTRGAKRLRALITRARASFVRLHLRLRPARARFVLPRGQLARLRLTSLRLQWRRRLRWRTLATLAGLASLALVPSSSPELKRNPAHVPALQRAVVAHTGGQGVNLRASPSIASRKVSLPEGTVVRLTGHAQVGGELAWTEVEVESLARVGWVATKYLAKP